jgi:hypothetical protein
LWTIPPARKHGSMRQARRRLDRFPTPVNAGDLPPRRASRRGKAHVSLPAMSAPIAGDRSAEAVQRAADEVYGLPLSHFTRARDELAHGLRKEGLRDEAEAVKALRKPTLAAWALNQLARRRPDEVGRLLAIGGRLHEAQEALLAGGDRSSLQRASAEERELVAELTRAATAIAHEAGAAGGQSVGERVRSTLHAAALDDRTAAALAAGRLVREQEAVGLFGAPSDDARRTKAPAKRGPDVRGPRKDAERRRELERERRAARAKEQKAQREQAGAAKAAARAGKRAKDAQRRADEARKRADEARAGVRAAERRERDAATAYHRAARALASAEKKLG